MEAAQLVNVVAPSDMEAGFQFQAEYDGQPFLVTVPEGGVQEGQTLEVPFTAAASTSDPIKSTGNVPVGNWRNEMCDCCETCPCPFFMGCWLPGIVLGQTMQRLKLNFIGMEGDSSNTCMIAMIITLVTFAASCAIGGVGSSYGGGFIYLIGFIWMVVAITLTRNRMRKQYKIPGSCCGDSPLDDCCCAYWCSCCVVLQMHRHTHDERAFGYDMTSRTGLDENAPEVV